MSHTDEGHRHRRSRGHAPPHLPSAASIALLVLVLLAGCSLGGGSEDDDLARSEFVEIVTSLREAERALAESDSAGALFEARKAEILAEHGVTEEDLRDFLRSRGEDVEALVATWDTISERLRYVPGADTLPSDTLPSDTLPSDTLPSDSLVPDIRPGDTEPTDTASPDTVPPGAADAGTARTSATTGDGTGL